MTLAKVVEKGTTQNYIKNHDELEHQQQSSNVNFSTFTRDDKVRKNINRAFSTPNNVAMNEARRIKRDHQRSAAGLITSPPAPDKTGTGSGMNIQSASTVALNECQKILDDQRLRQQ